MYSELISAAIASGGPHAAKTSAVKLMRSVKKVALRLIEVRCEPPLPIRKSPILLLPTPTRPHQCTWLQMRSFLLRDLWSQQ